MERRGSVREAVACRPLEPPWTPAVELFAFAGGWAPPPAGIHGAWGAWQADRCVAALVLERAGSAALLHGPVVVAPPEAPPDEALELAGRLVAESLTHAAAAGLETLFARPQGLDRIWVRTGFIPVPEAELPAGLRGRPGAGLYGWRGGSALWSAAGRATRARTLPER